MREAVKKRRALSDLRIRMAVLEAVTVAHREADQRALELVTTEHARRLGELNHAHEASIQDRTQFAKVESVQKAEEQLRAWQQNVDRKLAYVAGIVALFVFLIGLAVALYGAFA